MLVEYNMCEEKKKRKKALHNIVSLEKNTMECLIINLNNRNHY